MSVGIVTNQGTVVDPDNALSTKPFLQAVFYLLLCQGLVAMGRHQTTGGREDGAFTIALYRTAFQYEVQMVFVDALDYTPVVEVSVNLVVKSGLEFLAPTIEAEVEEDGLPRPLYRNKAMIASPCVVRSKR